MATCACARQYLHRRIEEAVPCARSGTSPNASHSSQLIASYLIQDGYTPLALCLQLRTLGWQLRKEHIFWSIVQTVHVLMSAGATFDGPPDILPPVDEKFSDLAAIVVICVRYWTQEQRRTHASLSAVSYEVFKRGATAVTTYWTECGAVDEKPLDGRRTVLATRPSEAGKPSLDKSMRSTKDGPCALGRHACFRP